MRFWIDCEWNEYQGPLISMALVAEDGREWYEVLPCLNPTEWVAANVMPRLGQPPVSLEDMRASLTKYFYFYPHVHIISDWPEDIARFCEFLVTGPGKCMKIAKSIFTFAYNPDLDAGLSEIPHNALSDARALRVASLKEKT